MCLIFPMTCLGDCFETLNHPQRVCQLLFPKNKIMYKMYEIPLKMKPCALLRNSKTTH